MFFYQAQDTRDEFREATLLKMYYTDQQSTLVFIRGVPVFIANNFTVSVKAGLIFNAFSLKYLS